MTPPDGMPPDALRELVREVLRDVLPALGNGAAPAPGPGIPPAPPSGIPATSGAAPPATPLATHPTQTTAARVAGAIGAASADGAGPQPVRLATDEDLHEFVLRVLRLADNPKRRRDLLAGRLRFTLAPGGHASAAAAGLPAGLPVPTGVPGPAANGTRPDHGDHRIDKGAVTERAVQAAASAGVRLVLGPRAVLTPLARDRARALGVPIEKER
jgi:hypothetical protein